MTPTIALIVPVYGNAATLLSLAERLAVAMTGRRWRLRFVIDASPDSSAEVATGLAARDARIATTVLTANVGQHRALERGLAAEPDADAMGLPSTPTCRTHPKPYRRCWTGWRPRTWPPCSPGVAAPTNRGCGDGAVTCTVVSSRG